MELNYCPYCGHELKRSNLRYCPYCGKKLPSPSSSQNPVQTTSTLNEKKEQKNELVQKSREEKIPSNQVMQNNQMSNSVIPEKQWSEQYQQSTMFSSPYDITKTPIYPKKPKIKFYSEKDFKFLGYYFVGVLLGVFFRFLLINDSLPKSSDLLDFLRISILVTVISYLSIRYSLFRYGIFIEPRVEKEYAFQVTLATTFFLGFVPDVFDLKEKKSLSKEKKGRIATVFVLSLFGAGLILMIFGTLIFTSPPNNTLFIILFGEKTGFSSPAFISGEILMASSFLLNLDTSFGFGSEIKEVHPKINGFLKTGVVIILFLLISSYAGNIFSIT